MARLARRAFRMASPQQQRPPGRDLSRCSVRSDRVGSVSPQKSASETVVLVRLQAMKAISGKYSERHPLPIWGMRFRASPGRPVEQTPETHPGHDRLSIDSARTTAAQAEVGRQRPNQALLSIAAPCRAGAACRRPFTQPERPPSATSADTPTHARAHRSVGAQRVRVLRDGRRRRAPQPLAPAVAARGPCGAAEPPPLQRLVQGALAAHMGAEGAGESETWGPGREQRG